MFSRFFGRRRKGKCGHKNCQCSEEKRQARTLCDCRPGECVKVSNLQGDASECHRLREMGFCEEANVKKIAHSGALICEVCEKQIVVSAGLAKNIIVE